MTKLNIHLLQLLEVIVEYEAETLTETLIFNVFKYEYELTVTIN